MSISRDPAKQEPEIKRERVFKATRIEKIFESIGAGFKNETFEYVVGFCLAITAIGELAGQCYSIKWYLLISALCVGLIFVKIQEVNKQKNDGPKQQSKQQPAK